MDLSAISLPRKILAGAGLLLLIDSFLPWYHVSVGGFSANESGWNQIGVVAWIFLLALLVIEGSRIFGVLPLDDAKADLATLAATALTLLFGIIYVIIRLSDGYLGFGFWLGLVLLIALAAGGYLLFKDSNAMATIKEIQAHQNKGGTSGTDTPPPTPPAV